MKVSTILWGVVGILLLVAIRITLVNIVGMKPTAVAILIMLTAVTVMIMILTRIAMSGRRMAKGAKKRRKKLLPVFYRKKKHAMR